MIRFLTCYFCSPPLLCLDYTAFANMKAATCFTLFVAVASLAVGHANIVDVAQEAGLTQLLGAVEYTGLGTALLGLEEGTVLAPTNEAFEGLLAILNTVGLNVTAVEDLPVEIVTEVLLYHVFDTTVKAADLTDGMTLTPLGPEGATMTVSVSDEGVQFVSSSGITSPSVIAADVMVPGTNVVVHVINQVLIPEEVANAL